MMSYSTSRASSEGDNDDDEGLGSGENTIQVSPENRNNNNGNKKKGRIFRPRLNFGLPRLNKESDEISISKILMVAPLRKFSYSELQLATNGFRNKIGYGGSSDVYKGLLEGMVVAAVKVFRSHDRSVEWFTTEIKMLNELRHRNVVRLLGWSNQDALIALVLEYLPNRSLDLFLHQCGGPILPWEVRYRKIAPGVASALLYIHEELDICVIHRNVNSGNVLLDSDFNTKLGDFGLAMLGDLKVESASENIWCILGYMDPDYIQTGLCTTKSDIYGFGVVALEIATGRRAIEQDNNGRLYLLEWVHDLHEKGDILEAADTRLGNAYDRREMERLLLLGLLCTKRDPNLRPSASLILRYLNFQEQMPLDPNYYRFSDDFSAIASYALQPPFSTQTPDEIPNHADSSCIEEEEEKDDEDDSTSSASSTNDNPTASIATFDIGIPPHYYNSTATTCVVCQQRQDYHLSVLYGMVDSLAKMLMPLHELPPFDKVLATIRSYTTCLVPTVPPPLDDWEALTQLILQQLSTRESSDLDNYNSCSVPEAASLLVISSSSLEIEIEKSALTIEKDEAQLKHTKELLARKREECSVLAAKLDEARETCLSLQEEVNAIEQRVTPALATLEMKRRQYAIIKQFERAVSQLHQNSP